jgi:Uma2 family endonuclease
VTSASTEDYDRGEKLRHYQQLASVREILIVSHREARMVVHRRQDKDSWMVLEAGRGQEVTLVSLGASLAVDDVYRGGLEDAPPART